jgi:hypothetical protein
MDGRTPSLYLAWQDTGETRRWFPVGRLRRLPDGLYEFVYIRGYQDAQRLAGMQPLLDFTDIHERYLSGSLFPHFQRRLMWPGREEYEAYIERLGLSDTPHEPLMVLARSGGHRGIDSFEVFEGPVALEGPRRQVHYLIRFFIHGMKFVRPEAQPQSLEGRGHEPLFLMWDWQNIQDPSAIMIRTEDNQLLGWVPRYYCADILSLMRRRAPIEVTIERVNLPSTPAWQRVLCRFSARWPRGFKALASPQYEPLVETETKAA